MTSGMPEGIGWEVLAPLARPQPVRVDARQLDEVEQGGGRECNPRLVVLPGPCGQTEASREDRGPAPPEPFDPDLAEPTGQRDTVAAALAHGLCLGGVSREVHPGGREGSRRGSLFRRI